MMIFNSFKCEVEDRQEAEIYCCNDNLKKFN